MLERVSSPQVDFLSKHWGDVASVLSLAAAVWAALLAKGAKEVAEQVRSRISNLDTMGDLSASITIVHEIMRLQRTQAWDILWDILLDRYTILQSHLIRSGEGAALTESQRTSVRTAIAQFRMMVEEIERARTSEEKGRLDTAKFNRLAQSQIDTLERTKISLRSAGA